MLCEKPLTDVARAEAQELVEIAKKQNVANCINHNLRYYPMVQQMRRMIGSGDLGEILVVQGTYSQDWLLYDTDWNWRIVAKENGPLRVHGRHRLALDGHGPAHHRPAASPSLCADLQIFHKTRKRPKVGALRRSRARRCGRKTTTKCRSTPRTSAPCCCAWATAPAARSPSARCRPAARTASRWKIFGTKCGVIWNQERPDELWIGHRNTPNQIISRTRRSCCPKARSLRRPAGRPRAKATTTRTSMVFRRFYAKVADRSAPVEYPTFADGLRGMHLLGKVLESAQKSAWVSTEEL